jgi:flavin reductase (DIM6/NTAB) family NADH-FMN oxidoreductase RutF
MACCWSKTVLDEQAKRTMLRKIPHGLYICGVKEGEEVNGFTASWVMQSSFKPPLVVNCVRADSRSHHMIESSQVFALSILESGQKDLAQKFFQSPQRVGNRFDDVEFYFGQTGCPIITSALGYVECQVVGSLPQGDHTVFLGEVIAAGIHREGEGLRLEDTGWNYGG